MKAFTGLTDWLYEGLEDKASAITVWQNAVVPDLLQTEVYARHVIGDDSRIKPMAPGMFERWVSVRMRRQQVLTREPRVILSAVLDESVLRHRVGDEQVMRDQLIRLAELAGRANIFIRVLPLDGQHAVPGPAFVTFRFSSPGDEPAAPNVVAIERLKNIVTIEDEPSARLDTLVFDALTAASLNRAASRNLILETADLCWPAGQAGAPPAS